jgi:hypothetical protein
MLIAVLLCAPITLTIQGTARSADGGAGGLTALVESFIDGQFPDAQARYWILEIGQEATPGELVLGLRAMVVPRGSSVFTESRFLLLVVDGHLRGAQSVPLENEQQCRPEGETLKPKQL